MRVLPEEEIFAAALEQPSPQERRTFLDRACQADAPLRARVEAMLAAHDHPDRLLEAAADSVTIDQPMAEQPGTMVGPYKLLQHIGEGGFGVVYMAEQTEPVRRKVAVKVIKPGMDTRQVIARFEAERQALAVMDHTNIARVMDAGATQSGRPYFVMELVRGTPITTYCDENNLPVRERLVLFASVCRAIQHAHTKGIIHRDIKSPNVLVTRQDGEPVVKVIDFGIAKAMGQQLTEKTLFTDFTQMIGTPLYMSPEQAELSGTDIDTRSDIYSLGVLLYELLTGSTPVDKEQMKQAPFDEVRRIIREDEPPKPSTRISTAQAAPTIAARRHTEPDKLARLVRGELDWIVMKALEKDRNCRYETANGMARDVERYLNDEHVQAYAPSAWYRFRKFARRNRRVLLTAAVLAISALVTAAALTLSALDYGLKQRDLAEQKENLRQETATGLYHALLRHAAALRTARQPGYRSQVWKNLHEAAALDTPAKNLDDIRREALACLDDPIGLDAIQSPQVERPDPVVVPQAFQHLIETMQKKLGGERVISAVTQDGETLATARRQDGVTLWGKDGRPLATAKPPLGSVHDLKFAPDGDLLIGGCEEGTIIWTVPGLATRTFFRGDVVRSLAIDKTGQLLATAGHGRRIELWSLASNRLVAVLPARSNYDIQFDAGGEFLLTLSDGTPSSAWCVKRTPEKHQLAGHRAGIPGVAFSPDGRSLASVSKDRTVKIWDAKSGRLVHACLGHNAEIQALAFSPDGKLLATGDWKGALRLWDPASGNALASGGALAQIWGLRFDASGRWLASAGAGGLAAWAVHQGPDTTRLERFLTLRFDAHPSSAIDLALHPGGSQLAFLRWDDRQIYTYDLAQATGPISL
ncbi:MAG: serine/threonine-protein kinase, partial [Pirellulales bacterium]